MDQLPPHTALLANLRAERQQRLEAGLQMPNASIESAMASLTEDIRAGKLHGFREILEGCLATNNPRGAASTFIDRLMPFQQTNGEATTRLDEESVGYYRTPPLITLVLSNALLLKNTDTLIDVGGGNGTTSAIFALLNPTAKVVCLEFQEDLVEKARKLQEHFRLPNMSIMNEDAFVADLSSATVLYLYYPFSDRLFSKFINRLKPQALPDLVLNGNNPELLRERHPSLSEHPSSFSNTDISWWRGNIRS